MTGWETCARCMGTGLMCPFCIDGLTPPRKQVYAAAKALARGRMPMKRDMYQARKALVAAAKEASS